MENKKEKTHKPVRNSRKVFVGLLHFTRGNEGMTDVLAVSSDDDACSQMRHKAAKHCEAMQLQPDTQVTLVVHEVGLHEDNHVETFPLRRQKTMFD